MLDSQFNEEPTQAREITQSLSNKDKLLSAVQISRTLYPELVSNGINSKKIVIGNISLAPGSRPVLTTLVEGEVASYGYQLEPPFSDPKATFILNAYTSERCCMWGQYVCNPDQFGPGNNRCYYRLHFSPPDDRVLLSPEDYILPPANPEHRQQNRVDFMNLLPIWLDTARKLSPTSTDLRPQFIQICTSSSWILNKLSFNQPHSLSKPTPTGGTVLRIPL